jgi:hypothetical protein
MNVRLIKETRDLLPAFVTTLLVIVLPYLIVPQMVMQHELALLQAASILALGVACVVMGGSAFGNEFQHRTMPLLLSQPIARSVLWRDKMLVLGAGIAINLTALLVCLAACCPLRDSGGWIALVLMPLCAFCGAPYWTLLLRQGLGGTVFAVAAPGCVLALANFVAGEFADSNPSGEYPAVLLLFIYCAVVYGLGYARFQRLEALDGPARELSLPGRLEAIVTRPLTRLSARFQGPFAALLRKEFRLQQISFLVAGLFFLIALAGFCLIKVRPTVAEGVIGGGFLIYIVILPLTAGAIAIAEERGWGMAEWHLTLPPSALKQWSAKMLVALPVSLGLGLLLPTVMYAAGAALLGRSSISLSLPPASELPVICAGLGGWVLGQLLVTSVAVYAASFSRNTLRAILTAFVILAASVGVFTLAVNEMEDVVDRLVRWLHWLGPVPLEEKRALSVVCGMLVYLLCLIQGFAWSNFRRHGASALRLSVQFAVILLSLWLLSVVLAGVLLLAHVH